jgi:hypothetical protein
MRWQLVLIPLLWLGVPLVSSVFGHYTAGFLVGGSIAIVMLIVSGRTKCRNCGYPVWKRGSY